MESFVDVRKCYGRCETVWRANYHKVGLDLWSLKARAAENGGQKMFWKYRVT